MKLHISAFSRKILVGILLEGVRSKILDYSLPLWADDRIFSQLGSDDLMEKSRSRASNDLTLSCRGQTNANLGTRFSNFFLFIIIIVMFCSYFFFVAGQQPILLTRYI